MEIALALEKAGESLAKRFGTDIPKKAIVKFVVNLTACKKGSVLPSDHCYNRTNNGVKSPPHNYALFLWIRRGIYRFVGHGYQHVGTVIRCPKRKV
jgi:hypothetical protein